MEILLILSSKSYCFPLYNVAIPVDDSFAGYGLFLVIDDRMAKVWFHFHSPESLFHCIDVCCSFEFESLSSFQLMKERIVNIHFSNDSLWMKALLEPCPFHSWKYTTVLLSFYAIQFLVLVLLCIWRWQSIIDPVTIVSPTHLSFPTKGFALASNVLLRILQSNEWKWWRVYLYEKGHPLSFLNVDWKEMFH